MNDRARADEETAEKAIYVVDDEDSIRSGIAKLLLSEGYNVRLFDSGDALLEKGLDEQIACVVLDLQMPGLSGLELQERLLHDGRDLPIIFVSGHGEIADSVRAMKQGAVDFLAKPFEPDALLEAITQAIEKGKRIKQERTTLETLQARVDRLTQRELEVMQHVVAGQLNKQIASTLGISEKTVKIHRARVMDKMEASSVAELVRDTEHLGIEPAALPDSDLSRPTT